MECCWMIVSGVRDCRGCGVSFNGDVWSQWLVLDG